MKLVARGSESRTSTVSQRKLETGFSIDARAPAAAVTRDNEPADGRRELLRRGPVGVIEPRATGDKASTSKSAIAERSSEVTVEELIITGGNCEEFPPRKLCGPGPRAKAVTRAQSRYDTSTMTKIRITDGRLRILQLKSCCLAARGMLRPCWRRNVSTCFLLLPAFVANEVSNPKRGRTERT